MQKLRRTTTLLAAIILSCCLVIPVKLAFAAAPSMASPAGLSILEMKMTGDEFVLLRNNSGQTLNDLSVYWLNAFNNTNPLAAGVSSSSQQLPSASLQVGQTLLLSSEPMQTCGASVAGELSVNLGDSGGFLQLAKVGLNSEGAVSQTPGDFVSWSSGPSGIIRNVPSSTKNPRAAFYRYFDGDSYAWQQADLNATESCQLDIVVAGDPGSSSAVTPLTLATTSPPATILGTNETGNGQPSPSMPAANAGLTAPQLSELLPNPTGTGNDSTNEFIEIYNPNTKPFELTGFILQTGISTVRSYTFPAGTVLAPQSFKAFYSSETKLTLSNTSSQAALLDPFGAVLSSTEIYSSAKDGLTWAIASGSWRWTTQPTPGAANIIKTPATKKSTTAAKKKTVTRKGDVKGSSSKQLTENAASTSQNDEPVTSMVHTWVLAAVAGVALLYGAYEYRRDITNRLYQLRTKFGPRRAPGKQAGGR